MYIFLYIFILNMLFAIEVNSVTPMPDERINQDNPLNIIMFSIYDPDNIFPVLS